MIKNKFLIKGQPVPKPRMTQSDKWKKRDCVIRYQKYSTAIQKAFLENNGVRRPFRIFNFEYPIKIKIDFYIEGFPKVDIDNLLKSILDSMVRAKVLIDDSIKYVNKVEIEIYTREISESYDYAYLPRTEIEIYLES